MTGIYSLPKCCTHFSAVQYIVKVSWENFPNILTRLIFSSFFVVTLALLENFHEAKAPKSIPIHSLIIFALGPTLSRTLATFYKGYLNHSVMIYKNMNEIN